MNDIQEAWRQPIAVVRHTFKRVERGVYIDHVHDEENCELCGLLDRVATLEVIERAARAVADMEQEYQAHKDDSSKETPLCSVCDRWMEAIAQLEAALGSVPVPETAKEEA